MPTSRLGSQKRGEIGRIMVRHWSWPTVGPPTWSMLAVGLVRWETSTAVVGCLDSRRAAMRFS